MQRKSINVVLLEIGEHINFEFNYITKAESFKQIGSFN
jgi:hypothetical protein